MIKSTFICDNCKSEYDMPESSLFGDKNMVAIELRLQFSSNRIENYCDSSLKKSAVWCRTCVMKHGLSEPYSAKDKEISPPTPPTFEELFGELIERLGFERRE